MRIVMLDLDTLRPDHLGCYGYERNTSPNIDAIAEEGCRFENYHCSDAPCLPSRAALTTGRFGIHNGVVGHGGTASDLRPRGRDRDFRDQDLSNSFFNLFRKAGYHTVSISSFPERHSAYWFTAGIHDSFNSGGGGTEDASEVIPTVMEWLDHHGKEDDWFLHINLWDAHTPYRAPEGFGNPFAEEPIPKWLTPEVFEEHKKHVGPHSIQEINMYDGTPNPLFPRQPGSVLEYERLREVIDGYDCGIAYMDGQIGKITDRLKEMGIYEDTAFLITADHGEDMGELGIYCEHAVADQHITRIPMIVKLPSIAKKVDYDFHYSLDMLPTLADYFGLPHYDRWDGKSFYPGLMGDPSYEPREFLVVSQCAHVCQRSVRFGHYLYMRTYHGGYHLYPEEMLFDLEKDWHEQENLAGQKPDLCAKACRYLCKWQDEMMQTADGDSDPMWTVIREGGPHHTRGFLDTYIKQLQNTGREEGAEKLKERYSEDKNR